MGDFTVDLGALVCLDPGTETLSLNHDDAEVPPLGESFFYLIGFDLGWGAIYETEPGGYARLTYSSGCE